MFCSTTGSVVTERALRMKAAICHWLGKERSTLAATLMQDGTDDDVGGQGALAYKGTWTKFANMSDTKRRLRLRDRGIHIALAKVQKHGPGVFADVARIAVESKRRVYGQSHFRESAPKGWESKRLRYGVDCGSAFARCSAKSKRQARKPSDR